MSTKGSLPFFFPLTAPITALVPIHLTSPLCPWAMHYNPGEKSTNSTSSHTNHSCGSLSPYLSSSVPLVHALQPQARYHPAATLAAPITAPVPLPLLYALVHVLQPHQCHFCGAPLPTSSTWRWLSCNFRWGSHRQRTRLPVFASALLCTCWVSFIVLHNIILCIKLVSYTTLL